MDFLKLFLFSLFFTSFCSIVHSLDYEIHSVELPSAVAKETNYLFRYYSQGRGFGAALPIYSAMIDSNFFVGYSDGSKVYVLKLSTDLKRILKTFSTSGTEIRGLVQKDIKHFAILVRRGSGSCSGDSPCDSLNFVLFETDVGSIVLDRQIDDRIHDFSLGDGRLSFGTLQKDSSQHFAAYYKIHGCSPGVTDWAAGHEGDTYKFFSADGPSPFDNSVSEGTSLGGWAWGCSHSMEERLVYNPSLQAFAAVCLSDSYPSYGIHFNHNGHKIFNVMANARGYTEGGLGGLVELGKDGYAMTFTAPQTYNTLSSAGTDVGFAFLSSDGVPEISWLTNTNGITETHSHLAKFGSEGEFVVGWRESSTSSFSPRSTDQYYLAQLTSGGALADSSKINVTGKILFSERDDWVTYSDGTVVFATVWNEDGDGAVSPTYDGTSSTLRIVRLMSAGTPPLQESSESEEGGGGPGGDGSEGSGSSSTGVVVGVVVGTLAVAGCGAAAAFVYRNKMNRRPSSHPRPTAPAHAAPTTPTARYPNPATRPAAPKSRPSAPQAPSRAPAPSAPRAPAPSAPRCVFFSFFSIYLSLPSLSSSSR
eukprot:GCRY01001622.1.p1 GENE.GCRY01001622.1~~GCRY01001622.1.p1  ORF type:complete len:590 (+),score=86.04 GCRY01001622.1:166-1935(+)